MKQDGPNEDMPKLMLLYIYELQRRRTDPCRHDSEESTTKKGEYNTNKVTLGKKPWKAIRIYATRVTVDYFQLAR